MEAINAGIKSFLNESNSTLAGLLLFSMKQAATSDGDNLVKFGFSPDIINLLAKMDMDDIAEYARYGSRYLNIYIDPNKFKQIHSLICVRSNEQQLINDLLRANASYQFLNDHFGLTSNNIAARKSKLRMHKKNGRSKAANKGETEKIYRALKNKNILARIRSIASYKYPELVLAIYRETQINADIIANLINEREAKDIL